MATSPGPDSPITPVYPLPPDSPRCGTKKEATASPIASPLDNLDVDDVAEVSDDELLRLFMTGPVVYSLSSVRQVVQISHDLVMKEGSDVWRGEAGTQQFAHGLGILVPAVHRVFSIHAPPEDIWGDKWYIVMVYVPGRLLEDAWPNLDEASCKRTAQAVARLIANMQL